MRRPSALAPLHLSISSSQASSSPDSPIDATLSDSGRFRVGALQINARGVMLAEDGSLAADPSAAPAGVTDALDFGELQVAAHEAWM